MASMLETYSDSDPIRIAYNVEPILDNVTGRYHEGMFGDNVLSGGLHQFQFTVVTGRGNTMKSTTGNFLQFRVLERYPSSQGTTNDTEDSCMGIERMEEQVEYSCRSLIENATLWDKDRYRVSDSSAKTEGSTTKWYEKTKTVIEARIKKNTNDDWITTPFRNPEIKDKKVPMKRLKPLIPFLDSMSKAKIDAIMDVEAKSEFDDKDRNILAAREGLMKTRMISEIGRLAAVGGSCWITTAHMGDKLNFDPMNTPENKLSFIRGAVAFKGMPENGTFLSCLILYSNRQTPLLNPGDKTPLYPSKDMANAVRDVDLMELHMMTLRSKVGRTGVEWAYCVSQSSGYYIPLSHHHYLKKIKFGFGGNDTWFFLHIMPDTKISRSTVFDKVDEDLKLVRAYEITVAIAIRLQIDPRFRRQYMKVGSLEKLYELINASKDITWDEIYITRDWWAEDHYTNPIRYLSALDIINIALGEYVPYWKQEEYLKQYKVKAVKEVKET